jgi:4-carboxymuconolactone decarboxylase
VAGAQDVEGRLFGDIAGRDDIDCQRRELGMVDALAAMPGSESQLRTHTRISKNMGLTASQSNSALDVQAKRGYVDVAQHARAALDKQLADAVRR